MDKNLPQNLPVEITDKYTVENNTLIQEVKDNPKDRIVVEIGDSKQPDFKPQFKLMRWDNEVNLSVRLKDDQVATGAVTISQEKIVWSKGNIKANFYDLPLDETHPEGAYEFEVILKEKPLTNKIEFTLNTKGLDFFYQPELTQKEIDEGASRPENVVGSYAVYASERRTNWTGGKEYKCGKVGHIFRPKVIDSAGTEVWGKLLIKNGILGVTIPQTFLDNAVYPIRHAAGLTIGYTTSGTGGSVAANNQWKGSQGTASSSGTVDTVTVACKYVTASSTLKPMMTDSLGNILTDGIGNLITVDSLSIVWESSNYTNKPSVLASTGYCVGVLGPNSNSRVAYDSGSAIGCSDLSNDYTTPTAPTDGNFNLTTIFSVYATYTAASGATNVSWRSLLGVGL